MSNVRSTVFSVITYGAGTSISLGKKGAEFFSTGLGQAVTETVAQVLSKGDIKQIDISDIAVEAIIKNNNAKEVINAILDINMEKGLKLNEANEVLADVGLGLIFEKVNKNHKNDNSQDLILKLVKASAIDLAKDASKSEN